MLRIGAPEAFLLAGQDIGCLNLPGAKRNVPADGGLLKFFFSHSILGEESERANVIEGLRSNACPVAGRDDARRKVEESILPHGLVSRQRHSVDVSTLCAESESEAAQEILVRLEWSGK